MGILPTGPLAVTRGLGRLRRPLSVCALNGPPPSLCRVVPPAGRCRLHEGRAGGHHHLLPYQHVAGGPDCLLDAGQGQPEVAEARGLHGPLA